jgi:hypothetical protein
MRILSILAFFSLGLFSQVMAQVDIANARANPKTFIFDDEKHTVHGYIYKTLNDKSSCCGNDAIYLEVKFDQTGTVTSAKTLTGKNDCYKKSIVDIVHSVKWDATGVTGTKTIYFEVKPIIACSGSPGENTYKPIPREGAGNVAVVTPVTVTEKEGATEVVADKGKENVELDVVVEEKTPEVKTPVVVAKEPVKEEESFLSDNEPALTSKETIKEPVKEAVAVVQPTKETIKETAPVKSGKEEIKNPTPVVVKTTPAPVATTKPKVGGPIKLPPQEKIEYVSRGDVKPDASHNTTWVNTDVNTNSKSAIVTYADEGTFAVNLRTALRKSGYCGLAHATVELETDPSSGRVVNSRVLATNDPKVAELVPGVIKELRFRPLTGAANRFIYTEFKTEIVCDGQKPKYNLDQVEDFLVRPTAANQ